MKKNFILLIIIVLLFIISLKKYFNNNNREITLGDSNIIGDVDGNGKIGSFDYILIRKSILGTISLDSSQKQRADTNNDGNINTSDYIAIKKAILYGTSIVQIKDNTNVNVTGILLNALNKDMDAGSTFQLTPTILPNNAKNKSVSYISNNPSAVEVTSDGLIIAKHNGKATITVTTIDGNKTATCNITVKNGNIHLFGWDQSEADKKFGPILDGLFTGKTNETIMEENIGNSFQMHFPDIAYVNGQYYAYYITYNTKTGKGGVGLAISNDGLNFENKGCVIQPDQDYDRNGAYFAGVWLENNTFYLVYESKGDAKSSYGTLENIALATSSDGINWKKQGVILYRNQNNWSNANIGTPDLYKVGSIWYLTFHGYDYNDCQIGIAHGTDLKKLTINNTPIIPTENNTLHSGTTGRRDIIYIDGWYYMVYEISTDQPYPNAKWTHQFARSKDMLNWTSIETPLLIQKNANNTPKNGFGYDGPCWVIVNNHIYVYFRGINNSTTRAELTLK